MAMPTVPGAGLAVVEAEVVLCPLEAFLDGPSQPCGAGQFCERRVGVAEDEIVGPFVWIVAGAADQQPAVPAFFAASGQCDPRPVVEPRAPCCLRRRRGLPRPRLPDRRRLSRDWSRSTRPRVAKRRVWVAAHGQGHSSVPALPACAADGSPIRRPHRPERRRQGMPVSSAAAIISRASTGLVAKGTSAGTRGLCAARPVRRPVSRQIQATVDQRLPETARIGKEHADLAVLHTARRAGILARNPDRVPALLHKGPSHRRPAPRPGSPAPPPRKPGPRPAARRHPSGCAPEAPAYATGATDPPAPPSSSPSFARSPTEDRPETRSPSHEAHGAQTRDPDATSTNPTPAPHSRSEPDQSATLIVPSLRFHFAE